MRAIPLAAAMLGATLLAGTAQADEPEFDWTGGYVGGHAGLSWGQNRFYDVIGGQDTGEFSSSGYLGGIQGGYNWQIDQWVFGGEAEGSASHLRNGQFGNACGLNQFGVPSFGFTGSCCFSQLGTTVFCGPASPGFGLGGLGFGFGGGFGARVEALGLFSGRVGYSVDRTLLFGKGGAALAHVKYVVNVPGVVSETPTAQRLGWIIGAGVEHALTEHWSIKAEYNYIDLGTDRVDVTSASGVTFSQDQSLQMQVAKIGLNYRF